MTYEDQVPNTNQDQNDEAKMQLDLKARVIDFYLRDQWIYYIDLDGCRNAARALDRIRQVSEKRWASTEMIAELCTILLGVNHA